MLSVVVPVYNEAETIADIVDRIRAVEGIALELIVVDDGSTDGTRERLEAIRDRIDTLVFHEHNQGKGAALRTGFQKATGEITLVQDADLEYDPQEYHRLIAPILSGHADVVYGSRFMGGDSHRVLYFWHSVANNLLTLLSNMLTNLNLSDMETCYKVFRTELIQSIDIQERGFGVEPELTAKVARRKVRIYEVGISYYGRTYEDGKKIGLKDALWAVYCIVRYNLFS
ncbi:MAG: glycosyltransferase family 2 protein [Candidatus Hydrogenedentes bacterium]|nr:glycosyltransferase family 2 protein [Candidatus Hydrogenedentota bacterium]